jgi:hypothetical protein
MYDICVRVSKIVFVSTILHLYFEKCSGRHGIKCSGRLDTYCPIKSKCYLQQMYTPIVGCPAHCFKKMSLGKDH